MSEDMISAKRCMHGTPLSQPCAYCIKALSETKAPPKIFQRKYGAQGPYNQELFEFLLHFQGLAYTDIRNTVVYVVLQIPFPFQGAALEIYGKINRIIQGERAA